MKQPGAHIGANNPNAKLNDRLVREICLLRKQKVPLNEIARMYHVSVSTVSLVSRKINWKHVSNESNPTYFGVIIAGNYYKVEREPLDVKTPLLSDIPREVVDLSEFIFDLESGTVLKAERGFTAEKVLGREALKWPLIIKENI